MSATPDSLKLLASQLDWNDSGLDVEELNRRLRGPQRAVILGRILSRGVDLYRLAGLTPAEIVAQYPQIRCHISGRLRAMWDRVVACWANVS